MPKNAVPEWDTTAANNTDVGGITLSEGMLPGLLNDAIREMMVQIREGVASKGSDIASASSIDLGAATGQYVVVTGTTTITSLGTVNAGTMRWVEFSGALILTYNGTALKLPGSANITTAAGDIGCFVSLGSGNWKCLHFERASGKPVVSDAVGKHKLWIPVNAMVQNAAAPPAAATVAVTSIQYEALAFDASSVEIAHFAISMPSSWNEGTVTFVPVWTAASGSGDVVWRLNGIAVSNDDAIPSSYTNNVDSTDTLIATGDLHRGPESSALTLDGSPAANDLVLFRVSRLATDGGDTLNADAGLLGIELFLTTDAAVDVA